VKNHIVAHHVANCLHEVTSWQATIEKIMAKKLAKLLTVQLNRSQWLSKQLGV
jgi:exoribonuclease II